MNVLAGLDDNHIHTHLCKHADGAPAEYVSTARQRKLSTVCFSDHAPAPDGYDARHRMTMEQFPLYRSMVSEVSATPEIEVSLGIEADYYQGCETFLGTWLPAQSFDLVLGSIHYLDNWGFDSDDGANVWPRVDVKAAWRHYFSSLIRLADARLYDAVAHPDLPKKFGFRIADKDLKEMSQPALDRIAAAGMAIEINTAGLRKTVREIYPSPLFLGLAHDRQIPILFGSDAHTPHEVAFAFPDAVALARAVGYTEFVRFRQRRRTSLPLPFPGATVTA